MPFFTSTAYAATAQFRGEIGAMVVDSDPIVKLVLFLLFLFSIFSWGIIIQKWMLLSRSRKRGQLILDTLSDSWSMVYLKENIAKAGECPLSKLFHEAQDELKKVSGKAGSFPSSMIGNIENRIKSETAQQTTELTHGLGFLASISNASPFIGLFGTVWGIYHALVGLSGATQVVLDKVAGPVGEALIMTAGGLFVAIPAVLAYNALTRANRLILAQLDGFAHDLHAYLTTGVRIGAQANLVDLAAARAGRSL